MWNPFRKKPLCIPIGSVIKMACYLRHDPCYTSTVQSGGVIFGSGRPARLKSISYNRDVDIHAIPKVTLVFELEDDENPFREIL